MKPLKDGERPEPPKDENGNPIAPPKGMKPPFGMKPPKDGKKPEDKESTSTATEV